MLDKNVMFTALGASGAGVLATSKLSWFLIKDRVKTEIKKEMKAHSEEYNKIYLLDQENRSLKQEKFIENKLKDHHESMKSFFNVAIKELKKDFEGKYGSRGTNK